MKDENAVSLGKKSAEKRGLHKMTPEERSNYMKRVRARVKATEQNTTGY